jgi:hypothetical protein
MATMKIAGVCKLSGGCVRWIFAGPDNVTFITDTRYLDVYELFWIAKPGHAVPAQERSAFKEPVDDSQQQEFLQKNFAKFVPVQFQKETNGVALIQLLHVKENMFAYRDRYYCGFKFTVPSWLDGDFGLVHILAKTEEEQDFTANGMEWNIIPEHGPSAGFESFLHDSVAKYGQLRRQFPFTHKVNYQFLARNRLEPGKTYAIWFGFQEKDMPDIAFAIGITSLRGRNEYGLLPLR